MAQRSRSSCRMIHACQRLAFWMLCVAFVACQKTSPNTPLNSPAPIAWPFAECASDGAKASIDAGQMVYARRCVSCHFPTGEGLEKIFPPLRHHAANLATSEAGQRYLMHVLLFGVQGKIEVEGHVYDGIMPAHGPILSDLQIAQVLSYVTYAWDNCRMYRQMPRFDAEQVAAVRRLAEPAQKVRALRPDLNLHVEGTPQALPVGSPGLAK